MSVSVLVVGKPAGGKTEACKRISSVIAEKGFDPTVIRDRELIEEVVKIDIAGVEINNDGQLIGEHSVVTNAEEFLQTGLMRFKVKDGLIVNGVHESMVKQAVSAGEGDRCGVFEIAIGPDNFFEDAKLSGEDEEGGRVLRQSGESLVNLLNKFHEGSEANIIIVDIEASFDYRSRRNEVREDRIPEGAMKFFADGGEMRDGELARLPENVLYIRLPNNYDDNDRFFREVSLITEGHIIPLLDGTGKEIKDVSMMSEGENGLHRNIFVFSSELGRTSSSILSESEY